MADTPKTKDNATTQEPELKPGNPLVPALFIIIPLVAVVVYAALSR